MPALRIRFHILLLLASLLCQQGLAQEVRTAPATTFGKLPVLITHEDEVSREPPPPAKKPDFHIESTQVKLVDVVESPPMAGLPPVEGTITLKVHSVADPGLPEPVRAHPPREQAPDFSNDPQVLEYLAELAEERQRNRFAFVSATVYDRARTRLTFRPSGEGATVVTAWSNIDFNHFSGFGSFEAVDADGETRRYQLMLAIGNENTEQRRAWLAARKFKWDAPKIPALPDGAPAFVIVTKGPAPESVELLEDLHALYRDEGIRMAEIATAREKAYEERKAHLLANPPKPKDVTVRFWKRNKSASATTLK